MTTQIGEDDAADQREQQKTNTTDEDDAQINDDNWRASTAHFEIAQHQGDDAPVRRRRVVAHVVHRLGNRRIRHVAHDSGGAQTTAQQAEPARHHARDPGGRSRVWVREAVWCAQRRRMERALKQRRTQSTA